MVAACAVVVSLSEVERATRWCQGRLLAGPPHRWHRMSLWHSCRSSKEDNEEEDEIDTTVSGVTAQAALADTLVAAAAWEMALEAQAISIG